MGFFLDTIYDVLFHPFVAMRIIAAEKKLGQSAGVFALSVCLPAVAFYLALKTPEIQKVFNVLLCFQILASFAMWFCGAAVLSLIAELLGGSGSAVSLLAALGYSHIPRLLAVPFFVLTAFLPGGAASLLLGLALVVVFIWTFILDIAAIKGAHSISSGRAILALVAPVAVLGAAAVFMLIYLGVSYFPGRM